MVGAEEGSCIFLLIWIEGVGRLATMFTVNLATMFTVNLATISCGYDLIDNFAISGRCHVTVLAVLLPTVKSRSG